jgi:hypothetical protein
MSLEHVEPVLAVTRAFLEATLPSEFAALTTGPIHDLESLCSQFDSEYGAVQRKVEIHDIKPVVEDARATVGLKLTWHFLVPATGKEWSSEAEAVAYLELTERGWRICDYVENRRSQRAGIFLEPAGGHEFADIKIAPLAAELSHMGLLIVFQVFNRTPEPLELAFTRLRHKACRVLASIPERPHVAPPGVTTTSMAILPIALPVEMQKLQLEFGLIGSRTSTAYNVTLDVGLHAAKLDSPKTKRWRGRLTTLPLPARLGLAAAGVALLLGGTAQLPKPSTHPRPEGTPAAAAEVADRFVTAGFEGDHRTAQALVAKHAFTVRKEVRAVIDGLARESRDELGPPRAGGTPDATNATFVRIGYPFVEGLCSLGRPEIRGWLVMDLIKQPSGWNIMEVSNEPQAEPCG